MKKLVTDLETLNVSLCSAAKSWTLASARLRFDSSFLMSESESHRTISSANIPILLAPFNLSSSPPRNSEKSVGLKTEPWGTPWNSLKLLERVLSYFTLMNLFRRKSEIQARALPPVGICFYSIMKQESIIFLTIVYVVYIEECFTSLGIILRKNPKGSWRNQWWQYGNGTGWFEQRLRGNKCCRFN